MTRQGWAERKVARKLGGQYISLSPRLTAELLRAEHRRAVRVVQAEIRRVKLNQYEFTPTHAMRVEETLDRLLAALQKGRT